MISSSRNKMDAVGVEMGSKEKADAWAYVIIGLLALPLLALGIGALVLPPGIAFGLLRRGIQEHKWHWTILGGIAGACWLLLLFSISRRLFGTRTAKIPLTDDSTS